MYICTKAMKLNGEAYIPGDPVPESAFQPGRVGKLIVRGGPFQVRSKASKGTNCGAGRRNCTGACRGAECRAGTRTRSRGGS